jgi:spore germination protein YaaH
MVLGWYSTGFVSVDTAHWDQLSEVSYISAWLTSAGDISSDGGYTGSSGQAVIAAAHAHGVQCSLLVQDFTASSITAVIGASERAHTIQSIVNEVVAAGGDGVNIDFEFVPSSSKADFVAFMGDLTTAMHAVIPNADVSLDSPADIWPGYDPVGLLEASDHVDLMAYDYHWQSGPTPGPVSPLSPSSLWGAESVTNSVDHWVALAGDDLRPKIILGLPLYGYDYPSTDATIPGTSRGNATATLLKYAPMLAMMYGGMFDNASQTLYYEYQGTDGWHQGFYDDAHSFGEKVDVVDAYDLGGIALWALGYEDSSFWDAISTHLLPAPSAGQPPQPVMAADGSTIGDVEGGCSVSRHGGTPSGFAILLLCGMAALAWHATRRSRRKIRQPIGVG